MTQILLIGSTGQVGQELAHQLPSLGKVTAVGRQQLDLTQPDQIRQAVSEHQPDIIVNAAAYTAVDKAETEVELAYAINATAPAIMADVSQQIGAQFLHISTDYVFDGTYHRPYPEDYPTRPLGVYGQSKRKGEENVLASDAQATIVRTAWVYGAKGHGNFVKTMLRVGAGREELRVVTDQIGSPSWSHDIAQAIVKLLGQGSTGLYHFTNSGVASWYDFAVAIFEEANALGFPLNVQRVLPITTEEYPLPAKRPAYSVLSNQSMTQTLGQSARHWREALRLMLKELKSSTDQ